MARYPCTPVSLSGLLSAAGIDGRVVGADAAVSGITQDSRTVAAGDLFCCVRGASHDGHDFAAAAAAAGAAALLADRDVDVDIPVVRVDDVRSVLGPVASAVMGFPCRSVTMIGVTGTNGKTSTATMLGSILETAGRPCEVMGTLTGERTTPEAIDLHARLADCVARGAEAVVMEVSSHALVLGRVDGIVFDAAVFTNLGRDHLDFHGTEEAYFAAKASLFSPARARTGIVNIDDPRGSLLAAAAPVPMVPFSFADAHDVTVADDHVAYSWNGTDITVGMGGMFTVMNSLAAATTARVIGVSDAAIAAGLASMSPVPGRFEPVHNDLGFAVIVDYAHTPESLRALLESARQVAEGRVIVVFGCGGDRDAGKRPEMGRVAAAVADDVIVTSDNPRSEDPASIIDEVCAGIDATGVPVERQVDRSEAIASAIFRARRGDIVVIAGKGHEATQETAGVLHPFSDVDVARSHLARRKETPT